MGVLLVGAGGHGGVVADLVRACGRRLVGFADAAKLGQSYADTQVCLLYTSPSPRD